MGSKIFKILFVLLIVWMCNGDGDLSGAIRRFEYQDEESDPNKKRKISSLGIIEGREKEMLVLAGNPEPKSDEEDGAYAGRNRKKLKHRRINKFEILKKKLLGKDGLDEKGNLDVEGLNELAQASNLKDYAHPDYAPPTRHYTLEDLDRIYPDPESSSSKEKMTLRNFTRTNRWERSKHFVEFRKPGELESFLPDEIVNYKKEGGMLYIFVQSSLSDVYPISIDEYDTIGHLKQLVWEQERHHRYKLNNMQAEDEKNGFKIESQEFMVNATVLNPDSRTLKWYNITHYTTLELVQVPEPITLSREEVMFTFHLLWWREKHRCWGLEEDSEEERDEEYKVLKRAYLEAVEESYLLFMSHMEPLYHAHEILLARIPNLGMFPNPELVTEERLAQFWRLLDRAVSPAADREERERVTREVAWANGLARDVLGPPGGPPRPPQEDPLVIYATREAEEEWLRKLAGRAEWNLANRVPIPDHMDPTCPPGGHSTLHEWRAPGPGLGPDQEGPTEEGKAEPRRRRRVLSRVEAEREWEHFEISREAIRSARKAEKELRRQGQAGDKAREGSLSEAASEAQQQEELRPLR